MYLKAFCMLLVLVQGFDAATHECYSCGYQKTNDGEMEKLNDMPFCNDFSDVADNQVTCHDMGCCAEIREYFTENDRDNLNATFIREEGRHGCEGTLDHYDPNSGLHVECPERSTSTPNCQAFTENIPSHGGEAVDHAEVCLCNTDRCNDGIPVIEPTTTLKPTTTECYSCGYKKWVGGGMRPLPNMPFCNDFADGAANLVTCPEGDCCTEIREYINKTHFQSLEVHGRHGCESSVDHYNHQYHVDCPDKSTSWPNCQAFTENLPSDGGDAVDHAEVCLCNTDRCNNGIPLLKPTTPNPPTTHQCYSCGYQKTDGGEKHELPGMPFCDDFSDTLAPCPDGDCCIEIREYFTITDADNPNVTHTVEVGRHGCESTLDFGYHPIKCPDRSTCWPNCKAFTDNLPNDAVDYAEVCLCNTDKCNNGIPLLWTTPKTNPTTTPTNGAVNSIPSLLTTVLLLAPFLYNNIQILVK